ncbi:hypothetical protein [Salmonella enterica]|uniref:hypothetical protein n=1 Tax=Salmonella enterica TaxID=28901 RepID=UPI0015C45098|nr:hypothetical protein [Salmonella enterica]
MPDSYNSCTFLTPEEKQIIAIDLQKEDQRKDSDYRRHPEANGVFPHLDKEINKAEIPDHR